MRNWPAVRGRPPNSGMARTHLCVVTTQVVELKCEEGAVEECRLTVNR